MNGQPLSGQLILGTAHVALGAEADTLLGPANDPKRTITRLPDLLARSVKWPGPRGGGSTPSARLTSSHSKMLPDRRLPEISRRRNVQLLQADLIRPRAIRRRLIWQPTLWKGNCSSLGWALAYRSGVGVLLTALLIPPLTARIRAEERLCARISATNTKLTVAAPRG